MKKGNVGLTVIAAFAIALCAMVENAQASGLPQCVATIMDCGCAIKTSGDYTVGAALTSASKTEDCIDISAANVNLYVGFDLTGAGAGSTNVGINILSSAKNANLLINDSVDSFGTGIQVAAANAIVDGNFYTNDNVGNGIVINGASGSAIFDFDSNDNGGIGVLINKGASLKVFDFDANDNKGDGVSMVSSKGAVIKDFDANDNTGTGVSLTKSSGSLIDDFEADTNSAGGMVLNGSSANNIIDCDTDSNTGTGMALSGSNGNTVSDCDANSNTGNGIALSGSNGNAISNGGIYEDKNYGIWLQASSKNVVNYNDAEGNTQAGIYIGCAADGGPTGAACSGIGNSDSNRVTVNYVGKDGATAQKYGVAVDLGDSMNVISGGNLNSGPSPDTIDDYIDENPDCDKNVWFHNSGSTSSPGSCIPLL